jgi:hypothetical protein
MSSIDYGKAKPILAFVQDTDSEWVRKTGSGGVAIGQAPNVQKSHPGFLFVMDGSDWVPLRGIDFTE